MRFCFLIAAFVISTNAYSKVRDLSFNHDVFNCNGVIKPIFELEKNAGVYHVDSPESEVSEASFEETLHVFLTNLHAIAPVRADFIKEISSLHPRIQYRSKVKIVRFSQPSNIILPEGCTVEPISATVFAPDWGFNVTINKDLFDLMTPRGKLYFLVNLSMDLLQVLSGPRWNGRIDDLDIDLLQSREFMACWFNDGCRPKNVAQFHKLTQNKIYNFHFYEQDHIIIPFPHWSEDEVVFDNETGLITLGKKIVSSFSSHSKALSSTYKFRGKTITFFKSLSSNEATFNRDGKLSCVPLLKEVIVPDFNNGSPIDLYNPCWGENDKITNAQLYYRPLMEEQVEYTVRINGESVILTNSIAHFTLYPGQSLKWLSRIEGSINFQGQSVHVTGMMKLFPSGKIECFQVKKTTSLRLPNGQSIVMRAKDRINSQFHSDLFCFKEDGSFVKSYDTYYHEAIKEL